MSEENQDYIIIERKRGGFGPFVWGAAIGAGIAILFAPRSGRQTRAEIRNSVLRMRDEAEGAARGVQRTVTDTVGGVREDVRDRIDAARDAFEAGRRAARETRQGDLRPRRPVGPPMDQLADEDLDTEV